MTEQTLAAFRETAAARLTSFEHIEIAEPGMRRAAVAMCAIERDGIPGVLVIKRAYQGRNAGQWGLPGGRVDDGETPAHAAVRELHEELGLTAGESDILGRLDDFPAAVGFAITPYVLAVDGPGALRPNPDEVHAVHFVELSRLAADDVAGWIPHPNGGRLFQLRLGPKMVIHAPTGAMLWQFREVVLLGREARVADYLQPDWTHR